MMPVAKRTTLDPIRLEAARTLLLWRRTSRFADELVQQAQSSHADYDARRRLRELVFGTVRWCGRYQFIIDRRVKKPPPDPAWAALMIGLHEICAMRTPEFAAVTQSVDLVRALGAPKLDRFVNGVLRAVIREGADAGMPGRDQPVEYATHRLSHPRWMVERWVDTWGAEETIQLCERNNEPSRVVLRIAHGQRQRVEAFLTQEGYEFEPGYFAPDALRLGRGVPTPPLMAALGDAVTVQDEAAQLVSPLILPLSPGQRGAASISDSQPPLRILDLCAAPGGKLLHLAELAKSPAMVVGADISARRLKRVTENVARLHGASVRVVQADGLNPAFASGSFDAVLLDAPCSGTGVLARRHDARWRRQPTDIDALTALQHRLLQIAVDLTRPGGIILYATCSIEPEENDQVVDALLERRTDVEEVGVEIATELVDRGRLRCLPHRHGIDGAFAVRLRRKDPA